MSTHVCHVISHRTARADNQGTALSFVSMKEAGRLEAVETALKDTYCEFIHQSAFSLQITQPIK